MKAATNLGLEQNCRVVELAWCRVAERATMTVLQARRCR